MSRQAYFMPCSAKEYECNSCVEDNIIPIGNPYIRLQQDGMTIFTHTRCVRELLRQNWVWCVSMKKVNQPDLNNDSTDEEWNRIATI